MLKPRLMNEEDRGVRERIETARNELTEEHLNSLELQAARGRPARDRAARSRELRRPLSQLRPTRSTTSPSSAGASSPTPRTSGRGRATASFAHASASGSTRSRAGTSGGRGAASSGTPRSRPPRCCRPSRSRWPTSGIDLRAQPNVELDLEDRPNKDPRAFCSPIEVPGRVVLVIKPQGGAEDWDSLFHEAGHTEHFAHTSPSLSMEERRLGDNAVTEGWAMLMQYLTHDAVWLERRLDFTRPHEYAAEGAARLLWFVRRYCAKLLYELEFHAADGRHVDAPALRRAPLRRDEGRAGRVRLPRVTSTTASTPRSTSARGRSKPSCVRTCGSASVTPGSRSRDAGSLLRELWAEGQKPTADELLRDVTGRDARARRRRRSRARGARRGLASLTSANAEDCLECRGHVVRCRRHENLRRDSRRDRDPERGANRAVAPALRQHDPRSGPRSTPSTTKLDGLWDETARCPRPLRFGDREKIVARARVEERLERAA